MYKVKYVGIAKPLSFEADYYTIHENGTLSFYKRETEGISTGTSIASLAPGWSSVIRDSSDTPTPEADYDIAQRIQSHFDHAHQEIRKFYGGNR